MGENTIKGRLLHPHMDESTWNSLNPILKKGEVGYVGGAKESANYGRYKVGDGSTAWKDLPWSDKGIYDAVDGVEVGGRNLLFNTRTFDDLLSEMPKTEETYKNLTVRGMILTYHRSIVCEYTFTGFNYGDIYTLSFYAKGNIASLHAFFHGETGYINAKPIACSHGFAQNPYFGDGNTNFGTLTSEWTRYWVTWEIAAAGDLSIKKKILLRTDGSSVGQEVYVCGIKFEKGNKATDWTPAPEDKADVVHNHTASDIVSGTFSTSLLPTIPVSKGGTGLTSLTSGQVLVGNGTGNILTRAIDTTSGGTSGSTSLITSGAVYTGLSGKLNLTGGTLSIGTFYGLSIKRNDASNGSGILFENTSGAIGGTGFTANGDYRVSSGTSTDGNILIANTTSATFPGTVTATSFIGNATSSNKWISARTISLTGAITGSVSIDGSGDVSMATTVNHTHNYAGSSTAGGAANSLAGFTNTTTTATAIDSATQNGHVYVNGTSGIYSQNDGAAFVQAYSTSWVAQIYQDYRTGQIALRGKNNGTWQSWRKVLDSSNYTDYAATKGHTHSYLPLSGGTLSGVLTMKPSSGNIGIELWGNTPFIDFHYNNDTADYSVRLICEASGYLKCMGSFIAGTTYCSTLYFASKPDTNGNSDNRLISDWNSNNKTMSLGWGAYQAGYGLTLYGNGITASANLSCNAKLTVTSEATFNGATVHKWAVSNSNSNAGNVHMTTAGYLRLGVASSKRYKHDITEIKDTSLDPKRLLELPIVQYKYNDGYLSEDDNRYDKFIPGFIAEDVAEIYPIAADYEEDGKVNDWNFRMIIPPMLKLIQNNYKTIEEQNKLIQTLTHRLEELETK